MRLALIGHGRMGKATAQMAPQRGHAIAAVFDGQTPLTLSSDLSGIDVCIDFSVPGAVWRNVELVSQAPRLMSEMVHAAMASEYEKARQIHHQLLPLMTANFIETNPIPVKSALSMMGLIEEHYHLPLTPISDENRLKLKAVLLEMGLI